MPRTKSYYHGFFKYGAISKSQPCKADVLDVQLKQSNFMTSTENVNKLCLFVQETEHLQVKLTMMVCPERACEMFRTSQTSVHSDPAFRKHEIAGRTWISSCRVVLNLANRIYLHQPSVVTSIGSLDLYEDYVLKTVFQLNQLA